MWFTSALQTKQTTSLKQNKNELQSAQFMMIVFTWKNCPSFHDHRMVATNILAPLQGHSTAVFLKLYNDLTNHSQFPYFGYATQTGQIIMKLKWNNITLLIY